MFLCNKSHHNGIFLLLLSRNPINLILRRKTKKQVFGTRNINIFSHLNVLMHLMSKVAYFITFHISLYQHLGCLRTFEPFIWEGKGSSSPTLPFFSHFLPLSWNLQNSLRFWLVKRSLSGSHSLALTLWLSLYLWLTFWLSQALTLWLSLSLSPEPGANTIFGLSPHTPP